MVKSRKRPPPSPRPETSDDVTRLRELLAEAQSTLRAIRSGEVDAVVVESAVGPRVYTLDGAEFDYRILIESMHEGALVLTRSAVILYANAHFARMAERPLAQLMGNSIDVLLSAADRTALGRLLKRPGKIGTATEMLLHRLPSAPMPARVSVRRLPQKVSESASFGVVVSDLTEVHKREELLRGLSRSLMQSQETERLQIASDLGDNIAQMLCTVLVRCQLLADRLPTYENAFREEVVEFVKLVSTTASEVQRVSANLRPHGLEILGLDAALRGVVAEFSERMGMSITVNCAEMTTRLSSAAELAIYRVLQDALRNVERHARARHVVVTLRRRGSVVQLIVKDDGTGFDTSDPHANGVKNGAVGLLSMRERATAVGGSLKVTSAPSTGTKVSLDIPLSPVVAMNASATCSPGPRGSVSGRITQ